MRVVIVGTGPAGCAAAIALCRAGRDVVMLGDGVDGVGEELHPAARPLLNQLGLSRLPGQLDCVGIRSAWDGAEIREENFLSHPFGQGWLLDRSRFGATLRRAAAEAGAQLRIPSRLLGVSRDPASSDAWRLRLSDGEERGDWIVDATGRRGAVARLLGVKRRRLDQQVALVGWLETDRGDDEDETLTVERTASGWWYCARLPGQRRVAGYLAASHLEPDAWESQLRSTRYVGPLVEDYRPTGRRIARAADSTLLEHCYGPGWMAIGDAAASYDPLASRGLISALSSGLEASSLVGAPESRLAAWQDELRQRFSAYHTERRRLIGDSSGRFA